MPTRYQWLHHFIRTKSHVPPNYIARSAGNYNDRELTPLDSARPRGDGGKDHFHNCLPLKERFHNCLPLKDRFHNCTPLLAPAAAPEAVFPFYTALAEREERRGEERRGERRTGKESPVYFSSLQSDVSVGALFSLTAWVV